MSDPFNVNPYGYKYVPHIPRKFPDTVKGKANVERATTNLREEAARLSFAQRIAAVAVNPKAAHEADTTTIPERHRQLQSEPNVYHSKNYTEMRQVNRNKRLADRVGTPTAEVFDADGVTLCEEFLGYMKSFPDAGETLGAPLKTRHRWLRKFVKSPEVPVTGYPIGYELVGRTETPVYLCTDNSLRTYQTGGKHQAEALSLDASGHANRLHIGEYVQHKEGGPWLFEEQPLEHRLHAIALEATNAATIRSSDTPTNDGF